MLTVFNVGQGDSLLLQPEHGCRFSFRGLLIDTGPSAADISNHAELHKTCRDVLITHSHSDHVGGLPGLLRKRMIHDVFLPFYLPEVARIATYLKGHHKSRVKEPNWRRLRKLNPLLVAENDRLCNHALVLNPPRHAGRFVLPGMDGAPNLVDAFSILQERGIDLPRDEIVDYRSPLEGAMRSSVAEDYRGMALQFVHIFIRSLAGTLIAGTSAALEYHVTRHVELASNQASAVFVFELDKGVRWLFTGDADESVFERLIRERGDIEAKYLKVPHHGSRENLTQHVLTEISPSVAIVSHGNRKFGRSKDSHPHHEVIDLLDKLRIDTYYTNPVVKGGNVIKPGASGSVPGHSIRFS